MEEDARDKLSSSADEGAESQQSEEGNPEQLTEVTQRKLALMAEFSDCKILCLETAGIKLYAVHKAKLAEHSVVVR